MTNLLASSRRRVSTWLSSSSIAGNTADQRSAERNRRAITSSIAGLALRGSAFVVVLISVPLTLGVLGPIRFGMWMTIASVVAILGVSDLGIGNGVLNNISRAFGEGDREAARRYLASGLAASAGVALALGVLAAIVYPIVPWAAVYNVQDDPQAASEAGPATAVFIATFLVGLPLSVVGQVRSAYQEGFVQSVFSGLGNVLTLILLLAAVAADSSLPVLVLAMASGPLLAALVNLVVLVRFQRSWLAPGRSDITANAMRSVVGVGLAFMILQVAYAVAFSLDPLVVAHVVGPASVADYSVVYRLFSIPGGLAAIALLPLWPAYREAISRHDLAWVRLTLLRSLKGTALATIPLSIVLAVVGPAIVGAWTSHNVSPDESLYLGLGAFTVVFAFASAFAMLLNGAQAMGFQIATMSLMAALNLAASVYLAERIGVAGVALGSVVAVAVALILPALAYVPRLLRRLGEGADRARALENAGGLHGN